MSHRLPLLIAVAATAIAACSSGSDNLQADGGIDRGGNGGIDRGGNGGVDRGGVSRGTITGFGSVIVNGIRFDTSTASILIDDDAGSEDDLEVGYVITVTGTIDQEAGTGVAEEVVFDAAVVGPVSRVDAAANEVHVLGQRVVVNNATRFDNTLGRDGLEGLAADAIVGVSGFSLGNGTVVATRIELADTDEFEISGTIESLDTGAMTFAINGQAVNFAGAMLEDFPADGLQDGQYVEVEGTVGSDDQLVASEIEFHDGRIPGDEGDEVELEGVITRFASATDFDISGQPVTTDADTSFDNGTVGDLAEGVIVEVEGELDASGLLVANEVEFQPDPVLALAGLAENVDAEAGTLTLLGTTVSVTEQTSFEDDSDLDERFFGLDDIATGDYVEVRAFDTGDGLVAASIERDNEEAEVEVEGVVELVEENSLTILGIVFQSTPETEFEGPDGEALDADEFFAIVMAGDFAEAEGTLIGDGVAQASSIELKTSDD